MKIERLARAIMLGGLLVCSIAFLIFGILSITKTPELPPKTEFADDDLNITFYPENNYPHPGETSNFYFEIMNKGDETIKKIDIKVAISYFGIIVYEQTAESIRDYAKGERVNISTQGSIPIITPPGEYIIQLHVQPENLNDKYLEHGIYVQPSAPQLLLLLFGMIVSAWLAVYLKKVKSFTLFIKNNFKQFTAGQRFIFLAIVTLIITAFTLALGLESLANEFAIISYFLIVIGIMNATLEYMKLRNPGVNEVLSTYVFSALVFLSTYDGISEFLGKIITAFSISWATFSFMKLERRKQRVFVKYLAATLFLWIIFNLYQNRMPYYSIGLLIALLLYLRER